VSNLSSSVKIGMSDPTSLASTSTVLYSAHEAGAIDDAWLESLAARKPKIYDSTSQMVAALGTGEIGFTPVAYYGFLPTLQAQGAHVNFVVPQDGASLTDSPYGLLKGAPHPAAASLLVSWLLSKEGQTSVVDHASEYGTMPGAPEPKGLPAQADLKAFPLPAPDQRIAKKEEGANYLAKFF
jgi:iron(III) transport system substrate-binding protein